jgi:aldehyde dehydrogenase (NAD+)
MSIGITDRLYIDGAWVESTGDEYSDVLNPATEEILAKVPVGNKTDVQKAIAAARKAFDEGPWPRLSVRDRQKILLRMAEVIESHADEITELNMREAGSTRAMAAGFQVGIPVVAFRDTVERVLSGFAFEQPLPPAVVPGLGIGQGIVSKEPIGVAGLVTAYNFPFFLNVFKVAPALAAGCTAVLKPAPTTPLEAFILGTFADEAGLPPGVLNIVTGDIEAGLELTTNPMVDMISFTGSDVVGRKVYTQAAASLKKVVLELGGKSANIICDDADVAAAAVASLMGITVHAGQGCALLTRTLVHRSRYDEFVATLSAMLDAVKVGDPFDETTGMGPLISAVQRAKVESLISTGREEGAQVVYGGGRPAGLDRGFFVEPTIFTGVTNDMTIARTEFFGPVGVVIPFDNDDEAVRLANDSDFGLSGGVWAKDPARAFAIAKQLRTGTVAVNGGGAPNLAAPFGGYKQSGLGREWGAAGVEEFLQHKSITWGAAAG